MWAGWTDEQKEGTFVDPATGEILDLNGEYAPFKIGEPNGEEAENCIVKWTDENNLEKNKLWVDISCNDEFCSKFEIKSNYGNQLRPNASYSNVMIEDFNLNTAKLICSIFLS